MTVTTGRPATSPENTTTPPAAARTGAPGAAARSTPRWPADQGFGGGSKRPSTLPGPPTGQARPPPPPAVPATRPAATTRPPAAEPFAAEPPAKEPPATEPLAAEPIGETPGSPAVPDGASSSRTTSTIPARTVMRPGSPRPRPPLHPLPDSCGQTASPPRARPPNGCTDAAIRCRNGIRGESRRHTAGRRRARSRPLPPPRARPPRALRRSRSRPPLGASRTLHTRPGPPGRLRTPRHRWTDVDGHGSTAAPARCECRSVRPSPNGPRTGRVVAARHVRGVRRGCHLAATDKPRLTRPRAATPRGNATAGP